MNDPGTAIQVISSGVRLIDMWAGDGAVKKQPPVRDRLFVPSIVDADLLDDVFGPIARYGAGDLAVSIRLQKGLRALSTIQALTPAIETLAQEALERSRAALPIAADVARVEAAAEGR